jgi:hypothetical protein
VVVVPHLSVHVRLRLPSAADAHERADVVVALTQDRETTNVRSGENSGRTLTHTAVIRSLTTLRSLQPPIPTFETTASVPDAADWKHGDLRVVGLLQERRSRRINGAGTARVNTHEGPPPAR